MSSLLRRAVNGTGNFPKNSNLQGCNIAKAVASAILQCSFSASDNAKFRRGAGRPFQRSALLGSSPQAAGAKSRYRVGARCTGSVPAPSGERKQHLLMAAGCQKCLCVTLDKSNRTPAAAGKRKEVRFYEKNDQRFRRERLRQPQQS